VRTPFGPLAGALLPALLARSLVGAAPPDASPALPLLLEGTVTVEEKVGDDRSGRSHRAVLLLIPGSERPGKAERTRAWIALRLLDPAAEGEEPLAAMEVLEGKLAVGEPPLEPAEEAPMELEESAQAIEGLLSLDVLRPAAIPPSAEEKKDLEMVVLGLAPVRLPVVARAQTSDGRKRIEVRLADGARPEFKYNDGKGTVTSFLTAHALGPAGSLESVEDVASVVIEEQDVKTGAERRAALKAADAGVTAGETAVLAREIEEIGKLFASLRPSKEIAPRIENLAASGGGRVREIASKVLSARLAAYRTMFEKDEDARKVAALIQSTAPDFTLEALDGKKVSLRELGRGKAVLLSFWGYG
jgi:hypothetical protein